MLTYNDLFFTHSEKDVNAINGIRGPRWGIYYQFYQIACNSKHFVVAAYAIHFKIGLRNEENVGFDVIADRWEFVLCESWLQQWA